MKYYIIILLCCVFASCSYNPREEFVDACYSFANVACPQHVKYIENDKSLSKLDIDVRTQATEEFLRLVKEEHERLNKNKEK